MRKPSSFRQQDVARAMRAAKREGLDVKSVKVEIDPDKTVRIVLDGERAGETLSNPFDKLPVPITPARRRRPK